MVAQRVERRHELRALRGVVKARRLHEVLVRHRRQPGRLRGQRQVERAANAVEHVDDRGIARRPADAFAGEAIDLRERARDQHVRRARREGKRAVLVLGRDIFGIGLVDHQQHVRAQRGVEPGDPFARQEAARGIVGVGEEHHPRPLGHAGQQRIDIGAIVRVRRHHRHRAAPARGDVIDREAIADIDDLVARPGIGLRRDVQQFVRTGAHDDAIGGNAVQRAQRGAQVLAVGIGIARRFPRAVPRATARRPRRRAGTQRGVVGRKLGPPTPVRPGGLAGNIGVDRLDPCLGLRPVGGCLRVCHDAPGIRRRGQIPQRVARACRSGRLVAQGGSVPFARQAERGQHDPAVLAAGDQHRSGMARRLGRPAENF